MGPRQHQEYNEPHGESDKDKEIRVLRKHLETMERERNQTEQVTSHYSRDNIEEKNERRAQSQRGPQAVERGPYNENWVCVSLIFSTSKKLFS